MLCEPIAFHLREPRVSPREDSLAISRADLSLAPGSVGSSSPQTWGKSLPLQALARSEREQKLKETTALCNPPHDA